MQPFITKRMILIAAVLLLGIGAVAWGFIYSGSNADAPKKDIELTKENIEIAIDRGIDFLTRSQRPDGSFPLYVCDNAEPERCQRIRSATATAGIFSSLRGVESDERIESMIEEAMPYILENMEIVPGMDHAVWNLFAKSDERYGRIPADIDDTVIMSRLLFERGIRFPNDEKALMKYRNPGNLFYNWASDTWNLSESERHIFAGGLREEFPDPNYFGVDCVVNADVLNYFALKGIQPPEICTYLNTVIQDELSPQCTFYYRNPYILSSVILDAVTYSNATCLQPAVPLIRKELLTTQKADGTWSANLYSNIITAQTLLMTDYRGDAVDKAVEYILNEQQEDGGWENAVIFPDLINPVFYTSRELVTAVAVRALYLYNHQ